MVYLGLIRGVSGVQFYCHSQLVSGGAQYSPGSWSEVRKIALEVAELAPTLSVGVNVTSMLTLSAHSLAGAAGEVFHAAWREPGNKSLLVLVANAQNVNVVFTLQLPCVLVDCYGSATALFQQRRQANLSASGALSDLLLGYGTAAFRLPLNAWEPQQAVHVEIAQQRNLVVNPSFEQAGNVGSPDGYTYQYPCVGGSVTDGLQTCADGSATAFADSRTAVHGTHSLRLTTPSWRGGARWGRLREQDPCSNHADTYMHQPCIHMVSWELK